MPETAIAQNTNDASASTGASATETAAAGTGADTTQQTQTVEVPPATTGAAAEDVQQPEPVAAAGAPEKYEFPAPDGTEYDPQVMEAFSGAAREANLTQDAAQKMLGKMAPALAARQATQVEVLQTDWRNASSADKEIGGDKLTENLGVARKALDQFGTPELRTLLEQTGLGNHPEVLRLLYRTGKAISADTFVGGRIADSPKTLGERLYADK